MNKGADIKPAQQLGVAIRLARERKGISQSTLSKKAGVSRTTLDHIERFDGKVDVGVLKIAAVARHAGIDFGVYQEDPGILNRKLERERAALRAASVRERHLKLAAQLAIGEAQAIDRLHESRKMVALWRDNKTCSAYYIDAWSEIVNQEHREAAQRLLAIEPQWVNAMFQNTPFNFDEPQKKAA